MKTFLAFIVLVSCAIAQTGSGFIEVTNTGSELPVSIVLARIALAVEGEPETVSNYIEVGPIDPGMMRRFQYYFDPYTHSRIDLYISKPNSSILGASYVGVGSPDETYPWPGIRSGIVPFEYAAPYPTREVFINSDGPLSDGRKTVWKLEDSATTGLSAGVYREGVDKTIAAIETATKKATAASPGGGSTDRVADVLDALGADDTFGEDSTRALLTSLQDGASVSNAMYAANTQGNANYDAAVAALPGFGAVTMPEAVGAFEDEGIDMFITPSLTITIPKNPFSPTGPFGGVLGMMATLVRRMIAWGIVVTFFIWAMGRIREMVKAPYMVTPFGDTLSQSINSIKIWGFGGGLGYAVRITALVLVGTTFVTLPLIVMAGITAGLPWSDLQTLYTSGPVGATTGMIANALALANQVVPWALLITVPVYYFLVEFILFPSEIFWLTFTKFLPL